MKSRSAETDGSFFIFAAKMRGSYAAREEFFK